MRIMFFSCSACNILRYKYIQSNDLSKKILDLEIEKN